MLYSGWGQLTCSSSDEERGPLGVHCVSKSSIRPHTLFLTGHIGADTHSVHEPATLVAWSQTGNPVESFNKCRKEDLSIWKHLLGF